MNVENFYRSTNPKFFMAISWCRQLGYVRPCMVNNLFISTARFFITKAINMRVYFSLHM